MADIELVIKIPEGLKKEFESEQWTALSCMEMKEALIHGTPLPKGHGRIVDIDNAVKDLESVNESFCTVIARGYGARVDYIGEVLKEADKEAVECPK